jgi:hypothetical protein
VTRPDAFARTPDDSFIGVFNEERETRGQENEVALWGFAIAGRAEREHPHPRVAYRAFWIDGSS